MSMVNFKNALSADLDRLQRATEPGAAPGAGLQRYDGIYVSGLDEDITSWLCQYVLLPRLFEFAARHGYRVMLAAEPLGCLDVTLITPEGARIVLDIQTICPDSSGSIRPFVLASCDAYAAAQDPTPGGDPGVTHYVLGLIYRPAHNPGTNGKGGVSREPQNVAGILGRCRFMLQEKWRIAADCPVDSSPQIIVSITNVDDLLQGNGPFACYDEDAFSHYWANYFAGAAIAGPAGP